MKKQKEFTPFDQEKPTVKEVFGQVKLPVPGEAEFIGRPLQVGQLEVERRRKDEENILRHQEDMREQIHIEEEIKKIKQDIALQDTADGGVEKTAKITGVGVESSRDAKKQSALSVARRQNWLKRVGKGLAAAGVLSWVGWLSWPQTNKDDVPRPQRTMSQDLEEKTSVEDREEPQ